MPAHSTSLKANMYDPRVYHMDLCILAYHLYHQSQIWPMDPYYETMAGVSERDAFMRKTNLYMTNHGKGKGFRGPGVLNGETTNPNLDPIITKYNRVNPWVSSFIRPETQWEFLTPSPFITQKIKTVYLCEKGNILPNPIDNPKPSTTTPPTDYIYCFEGGTGIIRKDNNNTNPAWSMMGFALARDRGSAGGYDVHIAFRGSRSGSAGRALADALISGEGNADWVTDMDFKKLLNNQSLFGGSGEVSEGFALSMQATIDNVFSCLSAIYVKKEQVPKNIYITGHSLGGALAAMCANALSKLPSKFSNLSAFPFQGLRLLSYSAPTVGNRDFVNYFNSRISASRFLIEGDPVTSDKLESFGIHAGARVLLPQIKGQSAIGTDAHEPKHVRAQLVTMINKEGVVLPNEANPTIEKYNNFQDLLNGQYTSVAAANSLQDTLPNYLSNFIIYLKVYSKISGTVQQPHIDKFIKVLESPPENAPDLKTLLDKMTISNSNMIKFFTICIALMELSQGVGPNDVSPHLKSYGLNSSALH